MKRSLFFLCFLMLSLVGKAQVTFDVNSEEGYPLRYTVIDAVNRYVSVESVSKTFVPNSFAKITIPATVIKSGETEPYHVTEVADNAFWFIGGGAYMNGLKQIILPEGIKRIGERAFYINFHLTEFYFPSTLEEIGKYAFQYASRSLKTVDLSNTKITSLPDYAFAENPIFPPFPGVTTIKLPQTLQEIGSGVFDRALVKTLEIPYNVHSISTIAFHQMKKLEEIEFKNPVPATITLSFPSDNINNLLNSENDNLHTIYVPIDATVAYKVPAGWSEHASKFREKVKIGPHGYTRVRDKEIQTVVPLGLLDKMLLSCSNVFFVRPPRRTNKIFTFFIFRCGGKIISLRFLSSAVAEDGFFFIAFSELLWQGTRVRGRRRVPLILPSYPHWGLFYHGKQSSRYTLPL